MYHIKRMHWLPRRFLASGGPILRPNPTCRGGFHASNPESCSSEIPIHFLVHFFKELYSSLQLTILCSSLQLTILYSSLQLTVFLFQTMNSGILAIDSCNQLLAPVSNMITAVCQDMRKVSLL